eukprot:TCALIF_00802-PA protein Name:"Similar to Rad17 Cell cycle checkpoint protein RAD17 (Mus musculus)" AED:0.16 eAED:0.16 QI:0/0.62/0.44/0.77/0.75/0.55/9/0/1123
MSTKWMEIDFEDEPPRESSSTPGPSKRPRPSSHSHAVREPPTKSLSDFDSRPHHELWLAKYEPKSVKYLAVHPKKVDEVRQWLITRSRKNPSPSRIQFSPLLLLTGPSGSGKTATIQALSAELGWSVQDYTCPHDVVAFQRDHERTGPYIPNDEIAFTGQWHSFEQFLLRANRYRSLTDDASSGNGRLVLLEDFPSAVWANTARFRQILKQYHSSSHGDPLILIVSTTSSSQHELNRLLPPHSRSELGLDVITFNPITAGNISKALRVIGETEAKTGRSDFEFPTVESLQSLVEASNGDIRGAINAFQISCLKGIGEDRSMSKRRSLVFPKHSTKTKKSGKRTNTEPNATKGAIGSRDSNLDLFHAIGKVVYAKRGDHAEQHPLLDFQKQWARKELKSNPGDIVELSPMVPESFTCFLHENYLSFFSNITNVAEAADILSQADGLFRQWNSTGKISLEEYGALISVRGLMYYNVPPASTKNQMRTFRKPEYFGAKTKAEERMEALKAALGTSGIGSTELFTVLAPYVIQCQPHSLPANCRELAQFTGQFRTPFPAKETQPEDSGENQDCVDGETEDFFIEEYRGISGGISKMKFLMCATLVFLAVQANQDPVYVEPGTENIVDETQKSIQDLFKMTAKPSDKYSGETCSDGIARPKREALEYVPCNDLKECSIPHCFCTTKGIWPPFRGVKNEHDFPILPQVVVLALEGAVTPNNVRLFREIFDAGLNPDQCMISGTVFTPLKDSNFVLLNELDSRGNEIAFLPGHFTQNDEGYAVIDNEFNFSRVVERYSALHQPIIGVKLPSDILVSEEHYPSVSAHRYVYDATLRAPLRYSPDMKAYEPPVWPYTLHAEIPHACEEHAPYTCPSRSYYLWEVPSNEFSSPIPGACLSLENCPGHPTRNSTLFVQLLETQLQRSLKTNRAPVVLHIRIETLERSRSHRLRLLQWIKDTLQTHSDVYFISVRRMLEWILSDNGKTEWQPIGKSGVCTADSVKTNCAPDTVRSFKFDKDLDQNFSVLFFRLPFLINNNTFDFAKFGALFLNFLLQLLINIIRTDHILQEYHHRFGLSSHELLHDQMTGRGSFDRDVLLLLKCRGLLTRHQLLLKLFLLPLLSLHFQVGPNFCS